MSPAIVVMVLLLVVVGFSSTMYWIASSMNERTRQLEERVMIGQETVSTQISQLLNMTKELGESIESMKENQTELLRQLSLVMQELELLKISLNQYAKYESIEITSAVCQKIGNMWLLDVKVKNTGTVPAILTTAFVNQFEVDSYGASGGRDGQAVCNMTRTLTMDPSVSKDVRFWISNTYPPESKAPAPYMSGTTLIVRLHSAGGVDHIKVVELV